MTFIIFDWYKEKLSARGIGKNWWSWIKQNLSKDLVVSRKNGAAKRSARVSRGETKICFGGISLIQAQINCTFFSKFPLPCCICNMVDQFFDHWCFPFSDIIPDPNLTINFNQEISKRQVLNPHWKHTPQIALIAITFSQIWLIFMRYFICCL